MNLDIDVDEDWPEEVDWPALAARAAAAVGRIAPELAHPRLAASLLLTGDGEVRALNARWRGKDSPTNVLSFPMLTRGELRDLPAAGPPVLMGDIALAYETCAAEAAAASKSLAAHTAHLLIHGLLHLAGHDHDTEHAAEAMESLEIAALSAIGLDNPYSTRP